MNKYFYLLASLCLAAFFGCQNDNDMNASFSKEKGTISATIDSVGKVHNYLLEQMKDSEIGLCISNKTKMKDLVNCFQRLNDNGKYCYNEIMTRADNDNADFSEFENMAIEDFDVKSIRTLVLKRINANDNIDIDVKKAIEIISDPDGNPLSEQNLSLIEQNKNKKGGLLLIVFKNIAEGSDEYWPQTRDSQSRAVIVADGIGGVLGTTCSGVMGILWGAGFSYACDMCLSN